MDYKNKVKKFLGPKWGKNKLGLTPLKHNHTTVCKI